MYYSFTKLHLFPTYVGFVPEQRFINLHNHTWTTQDYRCLYRFVCANVLEPLVDVVMTLARLAGVAALMK